MNKTLPPEERCQARVAPPGLWGTFQQHQCYKKFTVIRNGKRYCKIHDPEFRATKNVEADRIYEERRDKQRAQWKREGLLGDIFRGIETGDIERNLVSYKNAVKAV